MSKSYDGLNVLITREEINNLVQKGAIKTLELCKRRNIKRLILAVILTGGLMFAADLAREMQRQIEASADPELRALELIIDTISVWRYGKEESSNRVIQIKKPLDQNINGEYVLFIDEIVDNGITGSGIATIHKGLKPAGLFLISLLEKPERAQVDVQEYFDEVIVLQKIPDKFVQGYGLDNKDKGRCRDYICC